MQILPIPSGYVNRASERPMNTRFRLLWLKSHTDNFSGAWYLTFWRRYLLYQYVDILLSLNLSFAQQLIIEYLLEMILYCLFNSEIRHIQVGLTVWITSSHSPIGSTKQPLSNRSDLNSFNCPIDASAIVFKWSTLLLFERSRTVAWTLHPYSSNILIIQEAR